MVYNRDRNEPLDTLIELGREQAKGSMAMGIGLIVGPFLLMGTLIIAEYLQRPEHIRECVESLEHRHLPTDLCQDRCFRGNYLSLQTEYRRLELPKDKIDPTDLAYRRAREKCKND